MRTANPLKTLQFPEASSRGASSILIHWAISYQIRSSTASRGSWMQQLRFVYWPPLLTSQGHSASCSAFRVPQMYRSMLRHSRGHMAQGVRALLINLIHSLFNVTGLFMTWRKLTFSVDFTSGTQSKKIIHRMNWVPLWAGFPSKGSNWNK